MFCLLLAGFIFQAWPQDLRFDTPRLKGPRVVELRVQGGTSEWRRVDRSTNLLTWQPLSLLLRTGQTNILTDTNDARYKFYRVLETKTEMRILSVSATRGIVGDKVIIEGQFFRSASPGEHIVRFGGADARVLEASGIHLVVEVPAEARTGPVRVTTSTETAESADVFTVLNPVDSEIIPPAGLSASGYDVVNMVGAAPDGRLITRQGRPVLNLALPKETNHPAVLYAFSLSNTQRVQFSVRSTAEALVFMTPLFWNPDPNAAEKTFSVMRTNPAVAALGNLIGAAYGNRREPESDPNFDAAYSNAIVSVFNSPSMRTLAAGLRASAPLRRMSLPQSGDYPIDLEYIELGTYDKDSKEGFGPLRREFRKGQSDTYPYFTAVDWVVAAWKIDADKAFPGGRADFQRFWKREYRWPKDENGPEFPLVSTEPIDKKPVEAQAFNQLTVPVKTIAGLIFDKIKDLLFSDDNTTHFPPEDGLYVVRAFGPAFSDSPNEATFTFNNHLTEHIEVRVMNLVNAAMEILNMAIDLGGLEANNQALAPGFKPFQIEDFKRELLTKIITEAAKKISSIREPGDVISAASDLFKFALQEIADKLREDAVKAGSEKLAAEALARSSQAMAKAAGYASKANVVLKVLDISGAATQLALRALSYVQTSPMETAFVMVGDPFSLKLLSLEPNPASPGDLVTVVFQGPESIPAFGRGLHDNVSLEGAIVLDPSVESTSGPDAKGVQTVKFRIPGSLPASADGPFSVFVTASGRKAQTSLTITGEPEIQSMAPGRGFTPVADFRGGPFLGTSVRLRGINFNRNDEFRFLGDGSPVLVPDSAKTGSEGDVTIRVPAGAKTGPIRITHIRPDGGRQSIETRPFHILGPPEIFEVRPNNGPRGTSLAIYLENVGVNSDPIAVRFGNTDAPGALLDSVLRLAVPASAPDGPVQLTVETPAGSDTADFFVEPGIATGGAVSVGNESVVTITRAAQFVSGAATPADDGDFVKDAEGQIIRQLDPPREEGDFVTDNQDRAVPRFPMGAEYKDSIVISGTAEGDAILAGDDDRLSGGTYRGTLRITGDRILVSNMRVEGTIIVEGNETIINSITFANSPGHALIIRGHHTRIDNCDFHTNSADAIRLEGAQYTILENSEMAGNGGNGVTITGGAAYNDLRLVTGRTQRGASIPGSGNMGHGLAMFGGASNNLIRIYTGGLSANKGDGVYLSGKDVVSNRFEGLIMTFNEGNGMTLTNLGDGNVFSSSVLRFDNNARHGLAVYNSSNVVMDIWASGNGIYGVLASNVTGDTLLQLQTAPLSTDRGNGKAGLRVEGGTRGARIRTPFGPLRKEQVGVEIAGAETRENIFEPLNVAGAALDGIVLEGASGNKFDIDLENIGRNGLVVRGGGQNMIQVRDINNCTNAAIVLTDGTKENLITAVRIVPFSSFVDGNGTGIIMEKGARENVVTRLLILRSKGIGVILRDPGTELNKIARGSIGSSGGDGLLVTDGASNNLLGANDGPDAFQFLSLSANTNAGIRISGPGTTNTLITGCNFDPQGRQPTAIIIENGASDVTITTNNFLPTRQGIEARSGAHHITIRGNRLQNFVSRAILVTNAHDVTIGGPAAGDENTITDQIAGIELTGKDTFNCEILNNLIQNNTDGVLITDDAHSNRVGPNNGITQNSYGVRLSGAGPNSIVGNTIQNNKISGIEITFNSARNFISQNAISANPIGITVSGAGSTGNRIVGNTITANAGLGIDLIGGNAEIPAPKLIEYLGDVLYGTSATPDGTMVHLFRDNDDEGATFLAQAQIANGRFSIPLQLDPTEVGSLFRLNATVTDRNGNTSEFSENFQPDIPLNKIVFASDRDGNWEIYLVEPPLPTAKKITINPAEDLEPALSPDGKKVLFTSNRDGNREIYIADATEGATAVRLTSNPAPDYSARWVPGKGQIIFVSERDGPPSIFLMEGDGSNPRRLISTSGLDSSPSVSADGSKIVFASTRNGRSQLYTAALDGSGATVLFTTTSNDSQPVWSQSGASIVFVSDRSGLPKIYTSDARGANVFPLTTGPGIDKDPSWAPGDDAIFFASDRSGAFEIYTVKSTGGAPSRFTVAPGASAQPTVAAK